MEDETAIPQHVYETRWDINYVKNLPTHRCIASMECGDSSPLFAEPKHLYMRSSRVDDTTRAKTGVIDMVTGNKKLTEKRR